MMPPFDAQDGPDPRDADAFGGHGKSNSRQNGATHDGAEAAVEPLWIDADDWIEADLPLRPWVVHGYLLRGAVTLVSGPPSAMKSSLMLGWACSLALKRDYSKFHPREAAATIVYNVEDNRTEQCRRLSAVLRQFGAIPADIKGKVIRTGPNTIGTLLIREANGRIRFTPAMEWLEALVIKLRPAVLMVDPLAELHTSEENDNNALRAIIARFREIATTHNIAVVVLHHVRKGACIPGDPDISRGASSLIGAVRVAFTVMGMLEEDAKAFGMPTDAKARNQYVRFDDAKSNYAPLAEARWFEKTAYTLDNGETVPAAVPWTPPEAKVASQDDLAALAAAIGRGAPGGEPWSPRLSRDKRSVRHLLVGHGFTVPTAQPDIIARLEAEFGMEQGTFCTRARNKRLGLRIGDKPAVEWIDP